VLGLLNCHYQFTSPSFVLCNAHNIFDNKHRNSLQFPCLPYLYHSMIIGICQGKNHCLFSFRPIKTKVKPLSSYVLYYNITPNNKSEIMCFFSLNYSPSLRPLRGSLRPLRLNFYRKVRRDNTMFARNKSPICAHLQYIFTLRCMVFLP